MNPSIPSQMKAAAIDRFGGPEVIGTKTLPVPEVGPDEVLIRVDTAGIGVWDPYEREGQFKELGQKEAFPYVLGSDGAGAVAAVGRNVKQFKVGDTVYACGLVNPKGGFYAEYAAVKADLVAPLPKGLDPKQGGVLGADGITALQGLEDTLKVGQGTNLLIVGASGGVGHLAVQLAKRLGARVLAVASGSDGVEFVKKLGADVVVDGRKDDVGRAAREFAPNGLDAALVLAVGKDLDDILGAVREGGHVAHPNGVEPAPKARKGVKVSAYDGQPSPKAYQRLNQLIESGPFHVEVSREYKLEDAKQAHEELNKHHLGKLALRVSA